MPQPLHRPQGTDGMLSPATDSNQAVFNSRQVIAYYERTAELLVPERGILGRLGDTLRDRAVLDLGVGAGRTTPYLAPACGRYVGIDYAPDMVESCRRRFPHLEFQVADAADLSDFPDGGFALVWFAFNGIDYVDPPRRQRILREVHRVLEPGGLFVFSSHNLVRSPAPPPWLPDFRWTANPPRLFWRLAGALRRGWRYRRNYRRCRPHESRGDGYALLVDDAHDFALLTCFVTPSWQKQQLEQAGFGRCTILDLEDREIDSDNPPADAWLHYVASKES